MIFAILKLNKLFKEIFCMPVSNIEKLTRNAKKMLFTSKFIIFVIGTAQKEFKKHDTNFFERNIR